MKLLEWTAGVVAAIGMALGIAWMAAIVFVRVAAAASPEFCEVFAREWVRIHFLHNREVATAAWATADQRERAAKHSAPDKQAWLLSRNYTTCLNSDRTLKLPRHLEEASDQAWLAWLLRERPAEATTEEPVEVADTDAKAERDRACRRRFGSYDPDTGTVLRHGDKERTPCPIP